MTPEELDQLAEQSKPLPPPQPAPPAVSSAPANVGLQGVRDVLATMQQIDEMKLAFMKSEMTRQEMMEARIRESIMSQMRNAEPERNPLFEKAAEYLFGLMASSMAGKPAAPPPSAVMGAEAPPTPQDSVQTTLQGDDNMDRMKKMIDTIADQIYNDYPEECKKARSGETSKEDSIKKLIEGGVPANYAEAVYNSILAIEDPAPSTNPGENEAGLDL